MGIKASMPKYHITARNGGGPDGTDHWVHSHRAFEKEYASRYAEYYAKHHPHVTITLTPESGPFGIFTRFPTGYRHWSWTDHVSFVKDLTEMPKERDD